MYVLNFQEIWSISTIYFIKKLWYSLEEASGKVKFYVKYYEKLLQDAEANILWLKNSIFKCIFISWAKLTKRYFQICKGLEKHISWVTPNPHYEKLQKQFSNQLKL